MSTDVCVKRAHPQYVDVVGIREISFIEDDLLKTDMHSASSGVNVVDRPAAPRRSLVGIVPIFV